MVAHHPVSDLTVPGLTVFAGKHLGLLLSVAWEHLPPEGKRLHFLWHSADTRTAHAKAKWLPDGVWVQKTMSVQIATRTQLHLVLVTGVGDFRLQSPQKRRLSWLLTGTTHAHLHLNPAEAPPEQVTGLPAGMVSPFLPPRESGGWPIEALFVLPPPPEAHRHHVAVPVAFQQPAHPSGDPPHTACCVW
jgi:hypothetical protein